MSHHAPRPVAHAINETLARQLTLLAGKVERLEARNAELERQFDDAGCFWEEDPFELIADHRRGLINTDELYDRTVGR